jgi:hypothetical protein
MDRQKRLLLEKRIEEALRDMNITWDDHRDIAYIAQHIGQVFSLGIKSNDVARDASLRLFTTNKPVTHMKCRTCKERWIEEFNRVPGQCPNCKGISTYKD